jgi:hypothetical protein
VPVTPLVIRRRFRGPAHSANGGYACGLLASRLGGTVEVTLRLPPPLETHLDVQSVADGLVLRDGERLIAEARPAELSLDMPDVPSWDEVGPGGAGWGTAGYAECFVCGTRTDGSGLEIHPEPVAGSGMVAARWRAVEVCHEIVWAVIDCPGAFAVVEPGRAEPALGRMTGRVDRLPTAGERCVVVGWPLGADGRKLSAGTALVGQDGEILASSRQTWIMPRAG